MKLRIPVRDRTLRRWLATGRPARIGRRLAWDRDVEARLEVLSSLDEGESRALGAYVTIPDDFEAHTTTAVRARLDTPGPVTLLGELAGLAFRTGQVLAGSEVPVEDGTENGDDNDDGRNDGRDAG